MEISVIHVLFLPPTHWLSALIPLLGLGLKSTYPPLGYSDYRLFPDLSSLQALYVLLMELFSFQQLATVMGTDGGIIEWLLQALLSSFLVGESLQAGGSW